MIIKKDLGGGINTGPMIGDTIIIIVHGIVEIQDFGEGIGGGINYE